MSDDENVDRDSSTFADDLAANESDWATLLAWAHGRLTLPSPEVSEAADRQGMKRRELETLHSWRHRLLRLHDAGQGV